MISMGGKVMLPITSELEAELHVRQRQRHRAQADLKSCLVELKASVDQRLNRPDLLTIDQSIQIVSIGGAQAIVLGEFVIIPKTVVRATVFGRISRWLGQTKTRISMMLPHRGNNDTSHTEGRTP